MTEKQKIDDIVEGYIECAMWSENDESDRIRITAESIGRVY